jgi:hypothetical protein
LTAKIYQKIGKNNNNNNNNNKKEIANVEIPVGKMIVQVSRNKVYHLIMTKQKEKRKKEKKETKVSR